MAQVQIHWSPVPVQKVAFNPIKAININHFLNSIHDKFHDSSAIEDILLDSIQEESAQQQKTVNSHYMSVIQQELRTLKTVEQLTTFIRPFNSVISQYLQQRDNLIQTSLKTISMLQSQVQELSQQKYKYCVQLRALQNYICVINQQRQQQNEFKREIGKDCQYQWKINRGLSSTKLVTCRTRPKRESRNSICKNTNKFLEIPDKKSQCFESEVNTTKSHCQKSQAE